MALFMAVSENCSQKHIFRHDGNPLQLTIFFIIRITS